MTASSLSERAISPVIGTITLVLLTVLLTAIIGTTVVGSTGLGPASASAPVAISASADDAGSITLTHDGGSAIDVERTSVRVSVDGEPLEHQPPVPFFSARGFEPGPSGAFNSASEGRWSVGEKTRFTVAGTNAPALTEGATVEVRILRDERVLASAETSVEGRSGDGNEG
jgi:FlaG/FlaF family flagellin (archaellin)